MVRDLSGGREASVSRNLARFLAGTEGTLAVVREATVRLAGLSLPGPVLGMLVLLAALCLPSVRAPVQAMAEVLLCLVLFAACTAHVRLRLRYAATPSTTSS